MASSNFNHTYPIQGEPTSFERIYNRFLGRITDDMYFSDDPAGWTKQDTINDLKSMLIDSIPGFEFPRFPLYDYNEEAESYNVPLTEEEINIFAILMYNTWLQRQIASIENTRMKFSSVEFKMSSQANHLAKLVELKKEAERQDRHYQRLYKRRRLIDERGATKPNWGSVMERSALDG